MKQYLKRIMAFCFAVVVCVSVFIVGASASLTEEEQKFWKIFDYNGVNENMGVATFKEHWNKARNDLPLMINFGTQRVGYSTIRVPSFYTDMLARVPLGGLNSPIGPWYEEATIIDQFYLGHGNGFVYAGDGLDVPSKNCYMGHMFQRNTLDVNTGYGFSDVILTVELVYIQGALTDWTLFDISNLNLDTTGYKYEALKIEYNFYLESGDSGQDGPFYVGHSAIQYRTHLNGVRSSWDELTDGEYYGFMFGQTSGSIWNQHMNGSFEPLYYSIFEGPYGIDEGTDGLEGQRFGMISPLFYKEGYDVFYDPIYNEGYRAGNEEGYNLGEIVGYQSGYNRGLKDGFDAADTSQTWANMKNLIFSIFDAPFYVISYSLDFDLFGINIAGTLIALISTALIVWILKIILVKLF